MNYYDHHRQSTSAVSGRAPRYVLHKQNFYRHPHLRHCDNHCHHRKKPYFHQMNHSNRREHMHDLLGLKSQMKAVWVNLDDDRRSMSVSKMSKGLQALIVKIHRINIF